MVAAGSGPSPAARCPGRRVAGKACCRKAFRGGAPGKARSWKACSWKACTWKVRAAGGGWRGECSARPQTSVSEAGAWAIHGPLSALPPPATSRATSIAFGWALKSSRSGARACAVVCRKTCRSRHGGERITVLSDRSCSCSYRGRAPEAHVAGAPRRKGTPEDQRHRDGAAHRASRVTALPPRRSRAPHARGAGCCGVGVGSAQGCAR